MKSPVFDECAYCHQPIYAETSTAYGEEYVEFPGGIRMHMDCVHDFARENKKEARTE